MQVLNPTKSVQSFIECATPGMISDAVIKLAAMKIIPGWNDDDSGIEMLNKIQAVGMSIDQQGKETGQILAAFVSRLVQCGLTEIITDDDMAAYDALIAIVKSDDQTIDMAIVPAPVVESKTAPVAPVSTPSSKFDKVVGVAQKDGKAVNVTVGDAMCSQVRQVIHGYMKEKHPAVFAKYATIKYPAGQDSDTHESRVKAYQFLFAEYARVAYRLAGV